MIGRRFSPEARSLSLLRLLSCLSLTTLLAMMPGSTVRAKCAWQGDLNLVGPGIQLAFHMSIDPVGALPGRMMESPPGGEEVLGEAFTFWGQCLHAFTYYRGFRGLAVVHRPANDRWYTLPTETAKALEQAIPLARLNSRVRLAGGL